VVEEHESVAVPEPVTLVGVNAPHVSPAGTVSVRLTTPVNPFTAVTVIVDVPEEPTSIWAGLTAVADMVKSTTWNRTVPVVWVRVPSVPVTVTV
jgi:hypothetical protein